MSEPGFATIISYYFGALKNVMLALTSIAEPFFYIGFYYYMHLICQQPSFVYDATKIFKLLPIHYLLRFFFSLGIDIQSYIFLLFYSTGKYAVQRSAYTFEIVY